ncbi:hypothetical protein ST47_g3585 [Ascochyta rabiei]|uniref:Uncharacterized protein n=1 Tax=Didymella rabiei TaxID=5454 RepID=A0A163HFC1_DIDRA|nr:hypothetical protein ST47_g3585 [Ascochyta rabiei]
MRHLKPQLESDGSVTSPFQPTPAYLRDIESAGPLASGAEMAAEQSLLPCKAGKRTLPVQIKGKPPSGQVMHGRASAVPSPSLMTPDLSRSSSVSSKSANGTGKRLGDEITSALTITSTPLKLSASSEQFKEYVITTTYCVPRSSTCELPLVSVSVSLPSRAAAPKISGDAVPAPSES